MTVRPLVATVVAFAALLAGCSESTGGSPTPGDEPPNQSVTTEPSTEETTTSEPGTEGGIAELQPCEVLDAADLSALQLTGGEELKLGGARVCEYRREGATINESFTVGLGILDDQGLDDLNAPTIEPLPKIGSHEAVSFVDEIGNCGVAIGVGDSSRVETSATGGDQQQACQLASQLATLVEPRLP